MLHSRSSSLLLVLSTALSLAQAQVCSRHPIFFPKEEFDIHETCYSCEDHFKDECIDWASVGHCEKSPHFMIKNCRRSCHACENESFEFDLGVPQVLKLKGMLDEDDKEFEEELMEIYNDSQKHLRAAARNPDIRHLLPKCKNKYEECTVWAAEGDCDEKEYFMNTNCCPACQATGQLEFLLRCPMNPDEPSAWEPGDVNRFFERLTTLKDFKKYKPQVHSRPKYLPGDKPSSTTYQDGPWVVTLEEFLTEDETERLIELAEEEGLERSLDGGEMRPDGTADAVEIEGRTSMQTYCDSDCFHDPVVQNVTERLTNLTLIPEDNGDYLQMLRYREGERYHTHHDYHSYQMYTASGVRMLTIYMYLNDVEEGGGTRFPDLNITVTPKRGKALIWPSVLDDDPDLEDERLSHEALPVIKGIKYGTNLWFHQRDFKTPAEYGCAED